MHTKIGNVKIKNKAFLAPMLGVNCRAFRVLCRRYGAGMVYTAMVNVESIAEKKHDLIEDYVDISDEERPVAVQIVGHDTDKIKESVDIIQGYADIVDLNFGCCDPAVLANKSGAFLIKHPEQLSKVINAAADACNLKPLTAKIRIGWDNKSINAVETARIIEDAGASAIAVHARTRKQKYSGKADWDVIKQVKDSVNIPVIGNGDIFSPELAKRMIDKTRCDFVMVGRPAIGKPFIFRQIDLFLKGERYKDYDLPEQRYHLFNEFLKEYYNQKRQKFSEIRQHAMWFTKGMKGSKKAKNEIMGMSSVDEIKDYFEGMINAR